jgi:hypothetical protein
VYPKAAEQKRLRLARRPIQSKALVVNLATGEQREFERIRRIGFGGDAPKFLALQAYGPDAPAGGGAGGAGGPAPGAPGMGGNPPGGGAGRVEGTDLLLHELGTAAVFNIGNVADFAFDDSSDEAVLARITLAWIRGLRQALVGRGERSGFFRKATILHESIP